jgi:hypothetical protein
MKKGLKFLGILLAILAIGVAIFYVVNNESIPKGTQGKEADELATKMLTALNFEAYENTELIEWSFRNNHFYKWNKAENIVEVSWDNYRVVLNTKQPGKSEVFVSETKVEDAALIEKATGFFNNDSFWLVAPFKVFDEGVERRIVKHNDIDALLITYTTGGSTPGDSYLWILDDNSIPVSYKMWTSIIPIGGIAASWTDWITTESGIKLPTKHKLGLINSDLGMGNVKALNPIADALATNILKRIEHEAYINTRFIEWSFGGRRSFIWDKKEHIVDVRWDVNKVILHPNNLEKSTLFVDGKETTENKESLVKRAEGIFNNDSFWLVAPHKLFEPGIIRSIVKVDGQTALKVTYTIGGSTPGDSYVWILDDTFLPIEFRMYVPSMKMEGVASTWEDWITTESGTLLPKNHTSKGGRILSMGEVKAYH